MVSEESKANVKTLNWIVDPIDGTGNFGHGFPFFGISIGLWENSTPLYGCIYLPELSTLVYAVQGEGAWCNDQRLVFDNVSSVKSPYVLLASVAAPSVHGK